MGVAKLADTQTRTDEWTALDADEYFSRCQVSPGCGRRRRSLLAKSALNFGHQCQMLWRVTNMPFGQGQFNLRSRMVRARYSAASLPPFHRS